MLQNYFKTAIRNLMRYKGFSAINILSLTIGLIGCFVIGLFVWDEKQFDKSIPGGENVYRVYTERQESGNTSYMAVGAPVYATFLQRTFPEVEATARIMMINDKYLLEVGDNKAYEEKGIFVDSSFFSVFPLKFAAGDAATALLAPSTIVLNQQLAKQYFGNNNPIGKTIKIDNEDFTVKGVLAEMPSHFHLDFRYVMSLPSITLPAERMEKWTWSQFYSYVKLKPGTDVNKLQEKFQAHVVEKVRPTLESDNTTFLPYFQHLHDIHLNSADFVYDNAVRGNASYVKGLSIIAIFVLIIACFNFINLATARSFRRAKEIGVRKVIGADRKQLIVQFIGETILLSVISVILAATVTYFVVPLLNDFTGKNIEFNLFTNPLLLLTILASAVVIGVLAGIYPAMVLSGFQPIKVLKSMKPTSPSGGTNWIRQGLVVVQFALSALLIVSAIIVYKQMSYLNTKDIGFNNEQVIYFQMRGEVADKLEAFKSELKSNPNVLSVTAGYGLPGDQFAGDGVKIPGKDGEKSISSKLFIGDHDYIKTLGFKIIAGRDFSKEMTTDVDEAFIINETAVKDFGFDTPEKALGQPIYWPKWGANPGDPVKKGKVIGVVQDFHYKSLHEKVTASVIQIYPPVALKVAAKLSTSNIKSTIDHINNTWNRFSPGFPLDYKFMDETYGKMYESEQKLSSLLWIFTLMAIIVGSMGLFALAAFSAEQRTKEIGIRKVLGASVLNIMGLLSKQFVVLVLVSSIIAFPIAWYAMNKWLENFPYRISISWWVFAVAGIAAVVVALITVSFQTIKAAVSNPVKSLRTE
ncbi:ABC transporter permease [Aridibaculum aurantiacum]|uniref:ABC transporter permease n=1 Tax=Aridibaculum aurantiacum TaxID=2810307 RepID=UPI001A96533D|nr:ABC transporter permease [Aridibaculum aurantiacum]